MTQSFAWPRVDLLRQAAKPLGKPRTRALGLLEPGTSGAWWAHSLCCSVAATCGSSPASPESGTKKRKVVRFGMEALGAPLDMRKNGMSVAGTLTNAVFMSDWTEGNLQTLVNGWFADYPCGDGPLSYFETENSKSHSNFYANAEFDDLMA